MNIVIKAIRRAIGMLFLIITIFVWFLWIPVTLIPFMFIYEGSWIEAICFILLVGWVFFAVALAMDQRAIDKIMEIMTKIKGED